MADDSTDSEEFSGWAAPGPTVPEVPPPGYGIPAAPPPGSAPPLGYGPPPGGQWVLPGTPAPTSTNGFAVASLVLGLVSFCVGVVAGTGAIVFGVIGRRRAREQGQSSAMATTGMWLGIASTTLSVVFIGVYLVFFVAFAWFAVTSREVVNDYSLSPIECTRTPDGTVVASGSITNHNDLDTFDIEVWVNSDGIGSWYGSTSVTAAADESANFTAFIDTDLAEGDDFFCSVVGVD